MSATTAGVAPDVAPPGGVHLRIATIGNVDAGKSTLVGCLSRNIADDGRGKARSMVFHHKHELETGRTSAVATELMGFDGAKALAVDAKASRAKIWQSVHEHADKTVTFIDLCGHEKYLKTTIFGMTALLPDYAAVIVGSNMGVSKMTREHIGIAAALGLPLIIVVTKIDMSPPDVHAKTMETVSKVLKQARKMPLAVRAKEQVETAARSILSDRITPVICVSAVTGEGMDLLRDLLRQLPPRISTLAAKGEALHLKVPVGNGLADKVAPAAPASAPAAAVTAEAAGAGAAAAGAAAAAAAGTGAAAAPTAGAAADSIADTAPRIDGSAAEAAGTATGDATAATGAAALAAASAAPAAGAGAAGAGAAPTDASAATAGAGGAAAAGAGAAGAAGTHGADGPGESTIDSVFNVPGVGTVVAGTVMRGCVKAGSTMMLGPDRFGDFQPVTVRSIHVQYTPVDVAYPGGSAAFAVRPKGKTKGGNIGGKRGWARKGMALVDPSLCPEASWEFSAEILVLHHSTTLSTGYAPVMHIGVCSQSAQVTSIVSMADGKDLPALRTGDRALVTARFMYRPEYIHVGEMLLFREGRAKGVGRIKATGCPHKSAEDHHHHHDR